MPLVGLLGQVLVRPVRLLLLVELVALLLLVEPVALLVLVRLLVEPLVVVLFRQS